MNLCKDFWSEILIYKLADYADVNVEFGASVIYLETIDKIQSRI